jgi:acetate kinase
MKILVANLGSTSFKYRLFDMADERSARARRRRADRFARKSLLCRDRRKRSELKTQVPDHAAAVRQCLAQLTDPPAAA